MDRFKNVVKEVKEGLGTRGKGLKDMAGRNYNYQPQQAPPPPQPPQSGDANFLWTVFQKVDQDGNGTINANELQSALSNGTWTPFNPETVRIMLGMFDKNNSGTIDFTEFGALWKYVTDWQICFKSFDKDNSGSIDHQELQTALASFGYRINQSTVSVMMKKFSRLGNSTIAFDDFIQCCVVLHSLTNAFRHQDGDHDGFITIHYEQFLQMVFGNPT